MTAIIAIFLQYLPKLVSIVNSLGGVQGIEDQVGEIKQFIKDFTAVIKREKVLSPSQTIDMEMSLVAMESAPEQQIDEEVPPGGK